MYSVEDGPLSPPISPLLNDLDLSEEEPPHIKVPVLRKAVVSPLSIVEEFVTKMSPAEFKSFCDEQRLMEHDVSEYKKAWRKIQNRRSAKKSKDARDQKYETIIKRLKRENAQLKLELEKVKQAKLHSFRVEMQKIASAPRVDPEENIDLDLDFEQTNLVETNFVDEANFLNSLFEGL